MRYLGIDYGSKRIGLALSDEAGTMGFPHSIILRTPRALDELAKLIARERVGAVVIGESKNYQGVENPVAREARALGDALHARASVPVFYESETLTSAEARRAQEAARIEKSRAPKQRALVDDSAAALILTQYLSKSKNVHNP